MLDKVMSENQPLEESLKEKDKQINRLQMQIKLSSNHSKELERQKSLALEAQEEIKKSIQYASRIQTAMLPTDLPKALEIAVLWKPLNVVGGDFYIIRDLGDQILIAVIDCTGHGVPGALLSTLTNSIFDRIIQDENVKTAGDYLIAAHNIISTLLGQHADKKVKSHDGFDGSVCLLEKENKKLSFAGARSSIILITKDGEKIVPYIHAGSKLGVLVSLSGTDSVDYVSAGKDIGMQIAAMNPISLNSDGVDQSVIDKEIEIGKEQAIKEGKPENIDEKIAQGKLQKFFKENTLLSQSFVKDSSLSVEKYISSYSSDPKVESFLRISIG